MPKLTYRFIKPEDREEMNKIFISENGQLPDSPTFTAIVAEDENGKLAGFWCLELMFHAGPLWVAPEYRGTGIWRKLHDAINLIFRGSPKGHGYYVFSASEKTDAMYEKLGLINTGMRVFKKEF